MNFFGPLWKKYRFYYFSYLQLLLSPIKISFKPRILYTISFALKRSARQPNNCFQYRLYDSGNKLQYYWRIHLVFQTRSRDDFCEAQPVTQSVLQAVRQLNATAFRAPPSVIDQLPLWVNLVDKKDKLICSFILFCGGKLRKNRLWLRIHSLHHAPRCRTHEWSGFEPEHQSQNPRDPWP